MKTRFGLLTLLIVGILWSHCDAWCDISQRQADPAKGFPDIMKYVDLFSYQLTVEYKLPGQQQYDFFREYYDLSDKIGRVDYASAGKIATHWYSEDTEEGFDIKGDTCESIGSTGTPAYAKDLMSEWTYEKEGKPLVIGPSAMLLHGLEAWQADKADHATTKRMAYLGVNEDKPQIRGVNAQYFRRCSEDLQFEYYFTMDDHDDAFGFDKLKRIPLRVEITHKDGSNTQYPQVYDIVTFRPYIQDRTKLRVPVGKGCKRGEEVDKPKMPNFENKDLMIFGEAVYKDVSQERKEKFEYASSFMFALNVDTNHLAHFLTPWANKTKSQKTDTDGYKHMIYDIKNKYLYTNDIYNDNCKITRQARYEPKYVLPDNSGYISLTDPALIFPDDQFNFIESGMDRNMEVNTFEAIMEPFPLGENTVPKAIITRNYLKEGIEDETALGIENALTSIKMQFYDENGKETNVLVFNFFGFSTQLEHENLIFDVTPCFKKNDDSLWVTIGYPADPDTIAKIKNSLPSVEMDFRQTIQRESELNAIRMPTVLIDLADMIYVSFVILDKPSVMLDYLEPVDGKGIATDESDGIKTVGLCATGCLESEDNCWGFAFCGATCYYGTGKAKVESKTGCKLYQRYSNKTYVQSKEHFKAELPRLVNAHQVKLAVRSSEDRTQPPLTFDATYIDINSAGESDELFRIAGMETNPRLRTVKVGSKLDLSLGKGVKNLGKLRYDQCQRLCLDYDSCQTVSYCLRDSSCIVSTIYGEDIPQNKIIEDSFCNLLTRKYADQFVRTPGLTLSTTAEKVLPVRTLEECAKACTKETSFLCQSFDSCPQSAQGDTCRLHAIHILNLNPDEGGVSKETSCGHYSRKFNYDYKKISSKRVQNSGAIAATNVTLEQCAKLCTEFGKGTCRGYDYCEDETLTSNTCTLLDKVPSEWKIIYSPICNHFEQIVMAAPEAHYPNSKAAWVGILCFVISAVVGVAVTFGLGYWRANRAR